MRGVRFLDPLTNEVLYPDPLPETPRRSAVTPSLETRRPPAGSQPLNLNNTLIPAGAAHQWDVRRPFGSIVEDWSGTTTDRLAESATSPPTSRLELVSPQLPWTISVLPKIPNVFITVFDVPATIHASLRAEITPGEWGEFTEAQKKLTLHAKRHRIQECEPNRALDERYHHPRRVDTLGEVSELATVAQQNKWDNSRLAGEWERRQMGVLQTEHNDSLAATIELSLTSPMFRELGTGARGLLGVVAFFPQGIDEENFGWLFPAILDINAIFDKFYILSLAYRSGSFVTMVRGVGPCPASRPTSPLPGVCAEALVVYSFPLFSLP
ncbi:hypothetical protein BJ322DRAFT_577939 [Thelephora terrestris]|uniref:DUF6699 domain-containing protein n=1 Tax=Thelephora terrestris TaxID=56493 RepID=A0A9P6HHZ2_9AGAM|nr:hypothetical protein BJ322DRAFT_577939 [Thelephora terrestris]